LPTPTTPPLDDLRRLDAAFAVSLIDASDAPPIDFFIIADYAATDVSPCHH